MGSPGTHVRLVRFGPFELDLQGLELRRNGGRVPIQQLPLQLLVKLVKVAGVAHLEGGFIEVGGRLEGRNATIGSSTVKLMYRLDNSVYIVRARALDLLQKARQITEKHTQ